MKEKVVEILVYIMSEMQDNKRMTDIDLVDLKSRGYTQSEISAAFSWLYETMQSNPARRTRSARPSIGSQRILHDVERLVLSTESQGYLIQLRELGLLTESDLEAVIERAMVAGYEKLSLLEVRAMVASVLFAKTDGEGNGSRSMLDSRDSIH